MRFRNYKPQYQRGVECGFMFWGETSVFPRLRWCGPMEILGDTRQMYTFLICQLKTSGEYLGEHGI